MGRYVVHAGFELALQLQGALERPNENLLFYLLFIYLLNVHIIRTFQYMHGDILFFFLLN